VPALLDGSVAVYESGAVLRYLAIKFDSPLYPVKDVSAIGPIDTAYEHVRNKLWDLGSGVVFNNFAPR
jgi:hypothetical protein